jgi:16S rRNA (cytosine967-C5)-methyltransferase
MARLSPARRTAHEILLRVADEDAWASRLLDAIPPGTLDRRDLALAREIVLGALRWRRLLDERLGRWLNRPIDALDPAVREALRIGAYQLLFLDRIPSHAAVGESVELVRRAAGRALRPGRGARSPGVHGLVNAVLRKVAADRNRAESAADEAIHGLGIALSHPDWVVERAVARWGRDEARAWLRANNQPAPLTLRVNPVHPRSERLEELLAEEGVRLAPGALVPGSFRVLEGSPLLSSLFEEGAFWIQDEASQAVPLLFPPPWTGLSADLCAAPGGKSFILATADREGARGDGSPEAGAGHPSGPGRAAADAAWPAGDRRNLRVVAFELHRSRARSLRERSERIAPGRVAVVAADMAKAPPIPAPSPEATRAAPTGARGDAREGRLFERVLVDAPCSGTGVLRRHPEIRWRMAPERLPALAALQSRLLETGYRMLRTGGHLVYSVCSVEPEEGDDVVAPFLARVQAELVDPRPHLPPALGAAIGADLRLRVFPHRHGTDGFYAVLLRKPG